MTLEVIIIYHRYFLSFVIDIILVLAQKLPYSFFRNIILRPFLHLMILFFNHNDRARSYQ